MLWWVRWKELGRMRFVHPLQGRKVVHPIQSKISFPQQLFHPQHQSCCQARKHFTVEDFLPPLDASVMMPTNARSLVPSSVLFLLVHTVQSKHKDDWNKWYKSCYTENEVGKNNKESRIDPIDKTLKNSEKILVVKYVVILKTKRRLRNRVLADLLLDKGTSQNPWGNASASERLWNIWGGNCCHTNTLDICIYPEGKEASSSDKYCGEHGLGNWGLISYRELLISSCLSSVPALSLILFP